MNVSASETDHTSLNYKTPPAGGVTEPSGCLLSFSWNLRKQHMTQSALLLYSEDSMTCFYGSTQWMTRQSEELIMRCTLFFFQWATHSFYTIHAEECEKWNAEVYLLMSAAYFNPRDCRLKGQSDPKQVSAVLFPQWPTIAGAFLRQNHTKTS